MPAQQNRLSYPFTVSYRAKGGGFVHKHRTGWYTAIVTQKDERRMFMRIPTPDGIEIIGWFNVTVLREMIRELECEKPLRNLNAKERLLLFAPSKKERVRGTNYEKKIRDEHPDIDTPLRRVKRRGNKKP